MIFCGNDVDVVAQLLVTTCDYRSSRASSSSTGLSFAVPSSLAIVTKSPGRVTSEHPGFCARFCIRCVYMYIYMHKDIINVQYNTHNIYIYIRTVYIYICIMDMYIYISNYVLILQLLRLHPPIASTAKLGSGIGPQLGLVLLFVSSSQAWCIPVPISCSVRTMVRKPPTRHHDPSGRPPEGSGITTDAAVNFNMENQGFPQGMIYT